MSEETRYLTLRIHNEETYRALQRAAKELGVSMQELAESAILRGLTTIGADLEEQLARTVGKLKDSAVEDWLLSLEPGTPPTQTERFQEDIDAFAQAEVELADPLNCRMLEAGDKYGVGAAFARPLEQG